MKFTREQIEWLEDRLCNKVAPTPMLMRYKYGIGQCQRCLDVIQAMIDEVRDERHGYKPAGLWTR